MADTWDEYRARPYRTQRDTTVPNEFFDHELPSPIPTARPCYGTAAEAEAAPVAELVDAVTPDHVVEQYGDADAIQFIVGAREKFAAVAVLGSAGGMLVCLAIAVALKAMGVVP